MVFGLQDNLAKLVKAKFNTAKASGALIFSSTELAIVTLPVARIPFQFRFCPALAKKPKNDGPPKDSSRMKFDPFDNPIPELLIGSIPKHNPSHILVLNKYPIIPNHFILATKTNKEQTHILEEDDISMAYECLKEWEKPEDSKDQPGRLFAFFNSGEHSGASQAHRHLQFLPVEDIKRDVGNGKWTLLIDLMIGERSRNSSTSDVVKPSPQDIPFKYFSEKLQPAISTADLYATYKRLYESSAAAVDRFIETNPGQLERHSQEDGGLPISYNLGMTKDFMVICPRKREGLMVKRDDGSDIDFIALNGTVLGGTLMVKNEELWHLVQKDQKRLDAVLREIGIPVDIGASHTGTNL